MRLLPASGIRFVPAAVIVALVLLSGCTDIRKMLIERKRERFWEQYRRLDECQQVNEVQRYLSNGRGRDPILDISWPTNDMMLSMLMSLSQRTGISRNIMISCWSGFYYGPDRIWLELIEPWQGALGCNGPPADRAGLLRWCDPLLADAYDSLARFSSVRLGGIPRFRDTPLGLDDAYTIITSVPGIPRPDYWSFCAGESRNCMGLLPDDTTSSHQASFHKLDDSLIVMRLILVPDAGSTNGHPAAAPDSLGFLLRLQPDGTRRFIVVPYPPLPLPEENQPDGEILLPAGASSGDQTRPRK